jgi:hypothetical protein
MLYAMNYLSLFDLKDIVLILCYSFHSVIIIVDSRKKNIKSSIIIRNSGRCPLILDFFKTLLE